MLNHRVSQERLKSSKEVANKPPFGSVIRLWLSSLIILASLLLTLPGCSTTKQPEPGQPAEDDGSKPKELGASDSTAKTDKDTPTVELVRIAKRLYQSKMYTLSREPLQSLSAQGSPTAYRSFAEIKLADSYLFNGEVSEAAKRYEEFIKSYPTSAEIPYMKLQAARSYLALSRGAGRDRKPLERALALFDDIVSTHPTSEYAAVAAAARIPVVEELAAYDKGIIDFYSSLGNTAAVDERQRAYNEQWGQRLREVRGTPAASQASEKPLLALLGTDPRTLVAPDGGASESTTPATSTTPPSAAKPTNDTSQEPKPPRPNGRQHSSLQPQEQAEMIEVLQISCRKGVTSYALLQAEQIPAALKQLGVFQAHPNSDGHVPMPGLRIQSNPGTFDCLGKADLHILEDGSIQLDTTVPLALSAVDNPPRLLLSKID